MVGRKSTKSKLEKDWREHGAGILQDLINRRNKRGMGLTYKIAKAADLERDFVLKQLLKGKASLRPNYIQAFSKELAKYRSKDIDEQQPQEWYEIEATLASHAGQLMPSYLTDPSTKDELGDILDRIADFQEIMYQNFSQDMDRNLQQLIQRQINYELTYLLTTWKKVQELISKYQKIMAGGADEPDDLKEHWDELELEIKKPRFPLLTAYAFSYRAKILKDQGNTSQSNKLATEAWDALLHLTYANNTDEYNELRFKILFTLGDTARVIKKFGEALAHYRDAESIYSGMEPVDLIHRQWPIIKTINTYIMAGVQPLEHDFKSVELMTQQSQDLVLQARAWIALSYLEYERGGMKNINSALNYSEKGWKLAQSANDSHLAAVANQYWGVRLLHAGRFQEATRHFEAAINGFGKVNYGRRGSSNYYLGRTYAYLGLWTYLFNKQDWGKKFEYANEKFATAAAIYEQAYQKYQDFTAAHEKQYLLIEKAKWDAIQEAIRNSIDSGDESRSEKVFDQALAQISEAEGYMRKNETKGNRISILVNRSIVNSLQWYTFSPKDYQYRIGLEKDIDKTISDILDDLHPPEGFPKGATCFQRLYDGHKARLLAIKGCLELNKDQGTSEKSIGKSWDSAFTFAAQSAGEYDMLAVYDCMAMIRLLRGRDGVEDCQAGFEIHLSHDIKDRMKEQYITHVISNDPNPPHSTHS